MPRVTARGPEFQFYGQALQAAVDGLGIAMGIRPYIDDDLAAGRLVAPFALSVPKGMRWYLVYRSFRTEQRDFAAFRRWIMRAAAEPAGPPQGRSAMPAERIETLVIGGGQAGLTMSHRLKQRGLSHLVLERHRIAERWRSERWDGLRFQFPNWSVRLPDFAFPHDDPDAFAATGEIVEFIEAYAAFVAPPIRCGVAVTRLRRDGDGFVAETTDGPIEADNVVVATGPYQRPLQPDLLRDQPGLFQVHASRYANPQQLPDGAVLVVGAGASGAQIAEELCARRPPRLSLGRPAHPPAAPLSRPRPDLVARRAGLRRDTGRAARAVAAAAGDHRRLWRPHHRLPPLRRRGHHAARTRAGGARRRARHRARSCREPRQRRSHLRRLPRHDGRACQKHAPELPEDRGPRQPAGPALRDRADPAARPAGRKHQRGDLGHRLRRRFRLDRHSRVRCRAASRSIAAASPRCPASISSACNGCRR